MLSLYLICSAKTALRLLRPVTDDRLAKEVEKLVVEEEDTGSCIDEFAPGKSGCRQLARLLGSRK